MQESVFVGGGGEGYGDPQELLLRYANRHGLIAGATGTGKTVTLQILAEGLSAAGIPVILADVKGDLAGLSRPGSAEAKSDGPFRERARTIGLDLTYSAFPVTFWDVFGEAGHPMRTTMSEIGPLLFARLLELNDVQEGVLNVVFRVADEEGMALLDLQDLRALLAWVGENRETLSLRYGNVATASIGAIQRKLLVLEEQGGDRLFGEPALDLDDLMAVDADGRGRINVIAAERLINAPRLYATFLMWLLSELFEELPEAGDVAKPRLVFFFDEAHILFNDAPKPLVDKVEQVARLIRSKGVGVYFVTQEPADVPGDILGQLGNRVQHALRAFTAEDRRELKRAAETYRDNPRFDIATAIAEVGTGEAVTSFLVEKGAPGVAERTLVRPPSSRLGTITAAERAEAMAASPVAGKYEAAIDRESAHEILAGRAASAAEEAEATEAELAARADAEAQAAQAEKMIEEFRRARRYRAPEKANPAPRPSPRRGESLGEAVTEVVIKELKGTTGKRLVRGILGNLFKGR
jgi:DNA helicase HerA-like ATPase